MVFIIEEPVYKVGEKPSVRTVRVPDIKSYLNTRGSTQSTGTTIINDPSDVVVEPSTDDTPKDTSVSVAASGSASSSMGASEAFLAWVGRMPTAAEKSKMANEGWTEDTIRRYSVTAGAGTRDTASAWNKAADRVRQLAAPWYGGDPSAVPASLVKQIISSGDYADESYLTNTYFPTLKGTGATNPNAAPFVDSWTNMTGRALTYTAQLKLSEITKAYGFTDVGLAAWESWIKTTDSAATGNWGAEHRAAIGNTISSILGRAATDAELATNSNLWLLNDDALLEYVKTTPEYQAIYSGKPAWMDEATYISNSQAYDAVMRWYYGDAVALNDDGSLSIPTGQYKSPGTQVETKTTTTPTVAPIWKTLSVATFVSELSKYGVTATGSGGDASKYTYKDASGNIINYGDLMGYLPASDFFKDAAGYHYVQVEGVIDPRTNAVFTGPTKPATTTNTSTVTTYGLGNWGISYTNNEIVNNLINNNISPEMLQQQFTWMEEADYYQGVYGDIMTEAFGSSYSDADWYKMASGAQGSGAMRAKVAEAQNRVAFREVYRDYFGTDPAPSDYDYLTNNFVSPTEFTHRMAAKESAKAKIEQINELLGRTLDHQVTLSDLENLAMGGQGSGELQSMIDQATRLDAFTDSLYQYLGHTPTADDYAREVAKYPSAAAFKWEITVQETMDEMRDDINAAMVKAGKQAFTEDQLKIMLGKSEGWGALQAEYNAAAEAEAEYETARKTAMNVEKISPIYQVAEQGGFKQGLPALSDIGGM